MTAEPSLRGGYSRPLPTARPLHTGDRTVVLSEAEGQDVWSWDLAPSREWWCLVRTHELREIWLAELE